MLRSSLSSTVSLLTKGLLTSLGLDQPDHRCYQAGRLLLHKPTSCRNTRKAKLHTYGKSNAMWYLLTVCKPTPEHAREGSSAMDIPPCGPKKRNQLAQGCCYMDNVQLRNKIFFPKGSLEADSEPGTGQMNCGGSKLLSYHRHSSQIFSII